MSGNQQVEVALNEAGRAWSRALNRSSQLTAAAPVHAACPVSGSASRQTASHSGARARDAPVTCTRTTFVDTKRGVSISCALYNPRPPSRLPTTRPAPLPPLPSRPISLHASLTSKYGTHALNASIVCCILTKNSQSGKGKAYASEYTLIARQLLTFGFQQWQVLFWQGWW